MQILTLHARSLKPDTLEAGSASSLKSPPYKYLLKPKFESHWSPLRTVQQKVEEKDEGVEG